MRDWWSDNWQGVLGLVGIVGLITTPLWARVSLVVNSKGIAEMCDVACENYRSTLIEGECYCSETPDTWVRVEEDTER